MKKVVLCAVFVACLCSSAEADFLSDFVDTLFGGFGGKSCHQGVTSLLIHSIPLASNPRIDVACRLT